MVAEKCNYQSSYSQDGEFIETVNLPVTCFAESKSFSSPVKLCSSYHTQGK